MDHAEVQSTLDEAFFAPGSADDGRGAQVDVHLAECPECSSYSAALQRTALALDLARGPAPANRARVLAAARSIGRTRQTELHRVAWWRGALGMRLAAAALAIGVVGAGLGLAWAQATAPAPSNVEAQQLVAAVTMMAELAGQPQTHEMVLHDQAGGEAGMAIVAVETHQMAVFTTALSAPAQGDYRCYLERSSGDRVLVGPMHRADGVTFWAGSMSADAGAQPGDQLVVAMDEDGPALLSASF